MNTPAIEFYQANKTALESIDCSEAHEYINSNANDSDDYISKCNLLLQANQLCRETLIRILSANDREGIYSDEQSAREEVPAATKSELLCSVIFCEIDPITLR